MSSISKILTVLLFFLSYSSCKSAGIVREPRQFWGGTHTITVIQKSVVKTYVPSSCIQVAPTLPPCRNVRYLQFPSFMANHFNNNNTNEIAPPQPKVESEIVTPLGWGEYLGFYAPTVTLTEIERFTSIVEDPRIVVTFAVKGCKPSKLPVDLKQCPQEGPELVNIIPTLTAPSTIKATQVPSFEITTENYDVAAQDFENQRGGLGIEGGEINGEEAQEIKPTELLPGQV